MHQTGWCLLTLNFDFENTINAYFYVAIGDSIFAFRKQPCELMILPQAEIRSNIPTKPPRSLVSDSLLFFPSFPPVQWENDAFACPGLTCTVSVFHSSLTQAERY